MTFFSAALLSLGIYMAFTKFGDRSDRAAWLIVVAIAALAYVMFLLAPGSKLSCIG